MKVIVKNYTIIFVVTIIAFISTTFIISSLLIKCDNQQYIENNIKVDSIISENDSIKKKIKEIENNRNNEIITIINLDNDSTIKLFKKLVRE